MQVREYRIYSNKRRGAYLIFRVTSAALIRGQRLFEDGAYLNIVRDKFTFAVFLFNDIIASGVRRLLTFLSQVRRLFEGGA